MISWVGLLALPFQVSLSFFFFFFNKLSISPEKVEIEIKTQLRKWRKQEKINWEEKQA